MDGLNISVKGGEGEANIINWDNFHKTLNDIYTRDIKSAQVSKGLLAKSDLQLAQVSKGLREPDIPVFKQYTDAFRNASLMLQNPKVAKNPNEVAKWSKIKNDAYIEALSLADKSKQTQKDLHQIATLNATKKGWGIKPEQFGQMWEKASSLTSNDISNMGLNNPASWMRRVTQPNNFFYDEILGKGWQQEQKSKITHPTEKGFMQEVGVTGSKLKPHQIAENALNKFKADEESLNYFEDMLEKTDPKDAMAVIMQAQQKDPNFPVQLDAAHFGAALMVLKGAENKRVVNEKIAMPETPQQKEARAKRMVDYRSAASLRNFFIKEDAKLDVTTLSEKTADAFKKGEVKNAVDPNGVQVSFAVMPMMKDTKGQVNIKTTQPKIDPLTKQVVGQQPIEIPVDDVVAVKQPNGAVKHKAIIYKRKEDGTKTKTWQEEIELTPDQVSTMYAKEQKVPSNKFVKGVKKILGTFGKDNQPKTQGGKKTIKGF